MAKTMSVKGTGDDRKVILWERDAAHPRGEVMVVNDGKAYDVGETAAVKRLLGEGRLVTATTQAAPVSRRQTPPKEPGGNQQQGEQTPPSGDPSRAGAPAEPWEGYDDLKAEDVISRLDTLDDAGRASVLAYEQSKGDRGRKTIIEKLVNWNS